MSARIEELLERAVVALDRNANASEALISLAKEERDYGDSLLSPAFCPHCTTVNPTVRIRSEIYEGAGEIEEFVLVAVCEHCHKPFYSVPQGWVSFANPDEATAYLSERGGNHE